ncbi:MAG TPA: hypothetical protein VGJ16_11205, partial [Pirellulales bacterium]
DGNSVATLKTGELPSEIWKAMADFFGFVDKARKVCMRLGIDPPFSDVMWSGDQFYQDVEQAYVLFFQGEWRQSASARYFVLTDDRESELPDPKQLQTVTLLEETTFSILDHLIPIGKSTSQFIAMTVEQKPHADESKVELHFTGTENSLHVMRLADDNPLAPGKEPS